MSHVINISTNDLTHTLAEIISKHRPTEDQSVEYDLDIQESDNSNCVLKIDGDEYIIEVTE
jgi:hypothetical protein